MKPEDIKEMNEQAKHNPWIEDGKAFDMQRAKERIKQEAVDKRRLRYIRTENLTSDRSTAIGSKQQKVKWR